MPSSLIKLPIDPWNSSLVQLRHTSVGILLENTWHGILEIPKPFRV